MSDEQKTSEKAEQSTEQVNEINVDSETYLTMQMVKLDDDIASLELSKAEIELKIMQCKKSKMQAVMDYHYNAIKTRTAKEAAAKNATDTSEPDHQ